MVLQPTLRLVLLCIEVSQSHKIRHTVGLFCMSDHLVAEASTYIGNHNNI
jgi:hypothetical protein